MRRFTLVGVLVLPLSILFMPYAQAEDPLTVQEAIRLAIQNNLNTKLARAATEEARGRVLMAASGLLPQLTGSLQQSRVFKVNLESQGFPAHNPFFNSLVGPFNSFDARLTLVQSLLDARAFWTLRAGRQGKIVAELQEKLARDQVAAAAALSYLEAIRTKRAVTAAEADLDLSNSLLKLARDQHEAGVSARIDVARSETRQSQENLRLLRARLAVVQADLKLKRTLGIPFDHFIALPKLPPPETTPMPTLEKALQEAHHDRTEIQMAKAAWEGATNRLQAARAESVPSVKALADYGFSGTTPKETARTGSIGARLDLPILAGGSTKGFILEQSALQREAEDRYADVRIQLEEDVRLALETLKAEVAATEAASQAVTLAHKELKFSKDRFTTGMGDNIQVLDAQTTLARAEDDQIDSFARLDIARVNLAAALGHIQEFK